MKMFKVYAQCCRTAKGKRIVEAFESDLKEAFDKIFDDAEEQGLVDVFDYDEDGEPIESNDEKMEAAYDKIKSYWDENKSINVGDYMIVEAESIFDVIVPNMCGYDSSFIF